MQAAHRVASPPVRSPSSRPSIFDLPGAELDAGDGATAGAVLRKQSTPLESNWEKATELPRGGGLVIAVDVLQIDPLPGVVFLKGDFTSEAVQQRAFEAIQQHTKGRGRGSSSTKKDAHSGDGSSIFDNESLANVLLSDMAHSFTGEAHTDHLRQMLLSWTALLAAPTFLRKEGHLAVKVRYGEEYKPLLTAMQHRFRRVVEVKPPASRAESAEAFIVGLAWCGKARALAAATQEEVATLSHFGLAWPNK